MGKQNILSEKFIGQIKFEKNIDNFNLHHG